MRVVFVCVFALVTWAAPAVAQAPTQPPPPPTQPPAPPAAPSPQTGAAPASAPEAAGPADPSAIVFGSDAGLVFHAIKPDKAAEFEAVLVKLRDALQRSADPIRQQQSASLKIMKAAEPGPAGAVLYVFVVDPAVKGADYTISRLLAEAYPAEVEALWTTVRDAYAGGMNRLSLNSIK